MSVGENNWKFYLVSSPGVCGLAPAESLMATRYQDGGDSNASQASLSPVIPRLVTLSSPLSSHLIVTCSILRPGPRLGLSLSSSTSDGPGPCRHQPVPVTPLSPLWSGLAAAALSGPGSPLSLLTAILSSSPPLLLCCQPLVATPAPCAQSQLPAAYFDPRRV